MIIKNIILLDDHQIFRTSLSILLTENFSPITINQFSEPDSAIEYFLQCKKEQQPIDLIIPDQIHHGADGFAFASACRMIEKQYGNACPILLLSMTVNDSAQEGIIFNNSISPENPITLCLHKSVEKVKLINCISKLLM
jgi:DNA-binding NarL/FixJ family response regulator